MKLQQFNGGLNTRLAPNLIAINEGVEYENIDTLPGILTPISSKTDAAISVDKYSHYYLANTEWVSSTIDRDYLEYKEKLYYTEAGTYPKKYSGGIEQRLGIVAPSVAPTIDAIENQPLPVTAVNFVQGSIGSIHAQEENGEQATLQYVLTNIGTNNSASIIFAEDLALTGSATNVSVAITVIGGVNETKVYRYYLGVPRYVGTITVAAPTLIDAAADIEGNAAYAEVGLTGTYQYVLTYYNSVDGAESEPSVLSEDAVVTGGLCKLTNLPISTDTQVTNRKLYRIGGNLTDFTLVTTLDNVLTSYNDNTKDSELAGTILDSTYNSEALDGLQFLVEAYGVFFAALNDKVYYSRVGLPNAWPSTNYMDFNAPVTGIGVTANGLIIFTKSSCHIVTGTNTSTFIAYPFSGDQGCISHKSIQRLKGAILWVSSNGICTTTGNETIILSKAKLGKLSLSVETAVVHDEVYYVQQTNGKTLAFDTAVGSIYKQFNFGVTWLVKADDILYGYLAGALYSLQSAGTNEIFTYLSPVLTDGEYCNRKTYNHIYLRSEGNITAQVFIDGIELVNLNLTTTDTHDLSVPQEDQHGYSIQFKLSGTGTVYELEYKVMERQNGR
jgi:hypothetical protein